MDLSRDVARLKRLVEKMGTQTAIVEATGVSKSRLSRALADPTPQKLAPIIMEVEEAGLFERYGINDNGHKKKPPSCGAGRRE